MKNLTRIAMIAAIYTAVSLALAPISFGMMQVRISEALTILPILWKPAIWGVTLGCFLTNLLGAMTGLNPTGAVDAIVGTAATLIAAWCTWRLRDVKIGRCPLLSLLMPAVWNFVFVGSELGILFPIGNSVIASILINGTWVALGEIISAVLGYILVLALKKTKIFS